MRDCVIVPPAECLEAAERVEHARVIGILLGSLCEEGNRAVPVSRESRSEVRALRLEQQGYRIWTYVIPADITPKNRLLMAAPAPVDNSERNETGANRRTHET